MKISGSQMRFLLRILAVSIGAAGMLAAQSSSSSSSSPSSSSSDDKGQATYIRRIGIGATVSVEGLNLLSGGSNSTTPVSNATTTVTTNSSSTNQSQRFGYGVTAQAAITEHFAVAVSAYLRRMAYASNSVVVTSTTTFVNGTSTTTTTTATTNVSAHATLLDIPIAVRYYGRGRHTPGPRWFVEGGGEWRDVPRNSSFSSLTDNAGTVTCCTTNVAPPAHRNARGFLGGAGAQFIDPFGIRVVPEVRYVRWVGPIYNDAITHTTRNQVEAALTLSF